MPTRNDQDDRGWAMPRDRQSRQAPKGLHDYHSDCDDLPKPSLKDTALELIMTLAGIAAVFFLIIACVDMLR